MRLYRFILVLPFLWGGFDARAQVPEEPSASSMPEQWELTLDVIKSKAQSLLIENNGLQDEYRKLIEQTQQLRQSIDDQQKKNEQMAQSLQERHGQTDQQLRIEELTRDIKAKNQQIRTPGGQLENLKRQEAEIDRKNQLLKYAIRTEELHQQGPRPQTGASRAPMVDDQLAELRKQLEDESTQEVLLENMLGALKNGTQTQVVQAAVPDTNSRPLNDRQQRLEAKIHFYELRMEEMRLSSLESISWPLKKKILVHNMVLVDARNNKIRETIKVLREDIDVLRDQVAKLERRLDFARGR